MLLVLALNFLKSLVSILVDLFAFLLQLVLLVLLEIKETIFCDLIIRASLLTFILYIFQLILFVPLQLRFNLL